MTDIAVGGPTATDIFSIGNNWAPQNSGNDDQGDRYPSLGANGDEAADVVTNNRNEISSLLECKETAGDLYIPNAGSVSNSYVIVEVSIAFTPTSWPRMTVRGHQHDDNAHVTGLNEYAATVTIAAGFGVPEILADEAAPIVAGRAGATYVLTCNHIDVPKGDGEHLAGENITGIERLTLQFTGTPTLTTAIADGSWKQMSDRTGDANTAFDDDTFIFEKGLTRV